MRSRDMKPAPADESRDSVMTSRDSVMTSRDSVMTPRDSVMVTCEWLLPCERIERRLMGLQYVVPCR